ncbi:DUF6415 family natural product biosynthesis protein [Streptomyces sp. NPDC007863]|uniref:DUF6415 family natural product biosynthesis protein n=1 Tax=Streptomyces sp. NPDC007863 TaxID=3154894 RepID=UPI0033F6390A
MPEHNRTRETTMEVHLGALLVQDRASVDRRVERQAKATIRTVLALRDHPGESEVARLTDTLLTYCAVLANGVAAVPEADRCARGRAALIVWDGLRESGPADGPLGTWSYPRHLAVCARDMLLSVRDYRETAAPASFIGRTGLPPVRTDTP